MSKPLRVRGKIANLAPEQREKVHRWFRENLTYDQVKERCESEFGLKISAAALCEYYLHRSFEIFGSSEAIPGQAFSAEIILHIQIRPEVRQLTSVRANTIESQ